MSLWAKAQMLQQDGLQRISDIYADIFPIEVRHCLASWLEMKLKSDESEEQQMYFVDELVQEIQTQADMLSPEMFVSKVKLLEAANNFLTQYRHAPGDLYKYLRHCLEMEMEVINSTMPSMCPGQAQPTEHKYGELINGLNVVRVNVTSVSQDIRGLQGYMESFSIHYHECVKHRGHLTYRQQQAPCKDTLDMQVQLRGLIEKSEHSLKHLREQQLSGNGFATQSNLNTIQEWCETLAELIWTTRQQVNNVSRMHSKSMAELKPPHLEEMLDEMNNNITTLLTTLVTSTFVIEKQPPQVMKTNTRFTATVRLLVGGQLSVHMTPPRVTVSIISEQQAQLMMKSDAAHGRSKHSECGDILNNVGVMEYQPNSKQLSISFRQMQLRKIKRAEKKGTESVMDEKLTLLFQSDFNVGGGELVFQVWTLSLPVVVIVHGNQEPHGWATVTWDNAFASSGRIPFAVPEKVTWGQLADTLRIKFTSATAGDLTEENLRFLAEKIFRTNLSMSTMELNSLTVSWTQFCKDALLERNFTFWEWFYMVVKVTRDYLRTLWCDKLIMGFIQKKLAEERLSKCAPGTFLLRFSDSELGGITIAWVGEGNEVFSLQPFTARDLMLRSLADRILDLPQLQFLYPNTQKDQVFGKYYTKHENEVQTKNGYVKPVLVTTIPLAYSSPAYAHSPDPQRNTPSSFMNVMHSPNEVSMMQADIYEQIMAYDTSFDDIGSNGGF